MTVLSVRVDDGTVAWLSWRAEARMLPVSPAQRTRQELALWREHLAAELRRLTFTLAEANLLASCLQGVILDDSVGLPAAFAVAEVSQLHPETSDVWGVNVGELRDRLIAAGPTANHALVDACSRWWTAGGDTTPEGWAAVGVRVAS